MSAETISFEDFQKLDIRTAEIREAVRLEGTDKLLVLPIELGSETRQIVAGIAEEYARCPHRQEDHRARQPPTPQDPRR